MAYLRASGSRTIPPLPMFWRPASNWGLTRMTAVPCQALFGRAEGADDGGEDEGRGDEGDVHRRERPAVGLSGVSSSPGVRRPGVGALAERNAGVVAELLGDLAVAGVDGEDGGGSALEHAVGEAAGGGSDIDAGEAGEVKVDQWASACSSLRPPRLDIFEVGAEEANGGSRRR